MATKTLTAEISVPRIVQKDGDLHSDLTLPPPPMTQPYVTVNANPTPETLLYPRTFN